MNMISALQLLAEIADGVCDQLHDSDARNLSEQSDLYQAVWEANEKVGDLIHGMEGWHPCEGSCVGWHVFTQEDGGLAIQCCGLAGRYFKDSDALAAAYRGGLSYIMADFTGRPKPTPGHRWMLKLFSDIDGPDDLRDMDDQAIRGQAEAIAGELFPEPHPETKLIVTKPSKRRK